MFHYGLLQQRLLQKMKERSLSVRELERQAQLNEGIIRNILTGKSKNPTIQTLIAISNSLDCSIDDLIRTSASPTPSDILHTAIYNPELGLEVTKTINQLFSDYDIAPTAETTLKLLIDIYTYSVEQGLASVDRQFAKWIIQRSLVIR